jgi:predicted lipid-binding transport protein (Tim44 family)
MTFRSSRRTLRGDLMLGAGLFAAGAVMVVISLTDIRASHLQEMAQATPSPSSSPENMPPAESKPGGTRPTTPAPEPARPSAAAEQDGAKGALPAAPAEKVAPAMEKK